VSNFGIALEVDNHDRKGFPTAVKRLGKVERQARDFTPALREIRKSFRAAERQTFAAEGPGWQPDTPKTLARKAKRGQDPRTMRASGDLYRALGLGQGPGAIDEMSSDELTLGTSLVQGGWRSGRPVSRRRRVLVMTKRRRAKWLKIIRDHVTGGKP
jgi:hypothetical protein